MFFPAGGGGSQECLRADEGWHSAASPPGLRQRRVIAAKVGAVPLRGCSQARKWNKSLDIGAGSAVKPGCAQGRLSGKGQWCKRCGLGVGGLTCYRGLRLSSYNSADRGIKRPRVQRSLVMWLHPCVGDIIQSAWASESSTVRKKHEPARIAILLSVICTGKTWQSPERRGKGRVKSPMSSVSRKTSQIRIKAGSDGITCLFGSRHVQL